MGPPHRLHPKASVRLPVAERKRDRFPRVTTVTYTRYSNAAISNAIQSTLGCWVRYSNSAHMGDVCKQQLCIKNCGKPLQIWCWHFIVETRHCPNQRYYRLRRTVQPQYRITVCNDPTNSSKVDAFRVTQRVYYFLVISSNLAWLYFSPFVRYGDYRLKTHIFASPSLFSAKFENVTLALNYWNCACKSSYYDTGLINRAVSLPVTKTYRLATIHALIDDRQTTDEMTHRSKE